MPNFDAQHTDAQNAKAAPKAVSRDNDLTSKDQGSAQDIAARSHDGQQHITGNGGDAVTATRS